MFTAAPFQCHVFSPAFSLDNSITSQAKAYLLQHLSVTETHLEATPTLTLEHFLRVYLYSSSPKPKVLLQRENEAEIEN